jgi:hypothetical protein
MPVDREAWGRQLHLSNFVNAYYHFRDLDRLDGCRRVLIVGPGQGLQTVVLRWRGYEVVTLDIDEAFRPDVVGSVSEMSMFDDRAFDAVVVSHVLEHLAVPYLDPTLDELSRVATHALVYLPVAGRHMQACLKPGFKDIDLSIVVDLFNYLHRPSGLEPRYCAGQHYWELGMRGFRVSDLKARFSNRFEILDAYRNRDWTPSFNFVLRSRRWGRGNL